MSKNVNLKYLTLGLVLTFSGIVFLNHIGQNISIIREEAYFFISVMSMFINIFIGIKICKNENKKENKKAIELIQLLFSMAIITLILFILILNMYKQKVLIYSTFGIAIMIESLISGYLGYYTFKIKMGENLKNWVYITLGISLLSMAIFLNRT